MDAPEILNPAINEIVKRIVAAAHPDRIILFGSRARGDESWDSDFDVAVIVSGDIHRRKTAQDIYMSLVGVGCSVDVIVLKPEDIETCGQSNTLFVQEIVKQGTELYAA
jgi:predicted nucleotidyltransferase